MHVAETRTEDSDNLGKCESESERVYSNLVIIMSASVQVTYDLHPPAGTPSNDLSNLKTHEFEIKPEGEGVKAYYEALRKVVVQAKTTLGDELTMWRDAVGNREQGKEAKMPRKAEEEEDEDEEEA